MWKLVNKTPQTTPISQVTLSLPMARPTQERLGPQAGISKGSDALT